MDAALQAWSQAARAEKSLHVTLALVRERGLRAWVVGGAVRDALLGRPVLDYDLAVPGDSLSLAREVAKRTRFAYVPLDVERGIVRLVGSIQLDFAALTASDIEGDLRQRDLTVNALGVELSDLLEGSVTVLDPTGGLDDIRLRRIRVPSPQCFSDDPLRIVRVYRFASQLRYEVEEQTMQEARARLGLLSGVSMERVRDEMFKIVAPDESVRWVAMMRDHGVLQTVLRAFSPLPGDGVEVLGRLESLTLPAEVRAWLTDSLTEGRTRWTLLKLACLGATAAGAEVFRLSSRETRALDHHAGVRAARPPMSQGIPDPPPDGVRAARPLISETIALEYFERAQDDSIDGLVLQAARTSQSFQVETWHLYQAWVAAGKQPLLRGNDIMRELNLKPGPLVGRLTTMLRRAQTLGRVSAVADALAYLKEESNAIQGPG